MPSHFPWLTLGLPAGGFMPTLPIGQPFCGSRPTLILWQSPWWSSTRSRVVAPLSRVSSRTTGFWSRPMPRTATVQHQIFLDPKRPFAVFTRELTCGATMLSGNVTLQRIRAVKIPSAEEALDALLEAPDTWYRAYQHLQDREQESAHSKDHTERTAHLGLLSI